MLCTLWSRCLRLSFSLALSLSFALFLSIYLSLCLCENVLQCVSFYWQSSCTCECLFIYLFIFVDKAKSISSYRCCALEKPWLDSLLHSTNLEVLSTSIRSTYFKSIIPSSIVSGTANETLRHRTESSISLLFQTMVGLKRVFPSWPWPSNHSSIICSTCKSLSRQTEEPFTSPRRHRKGILGNAWTEQRGLLAGPPSQPHPSHCNRQWLFLLRRHKVTLTYVLFELQIYQLVNFLYDCAWKQWIIVIFALESVDKM